MVIHYIHTKHNPWSVEHSCTHLNLGSDAKATCLCTAHMAPFRSATHHAYLLGYQGETDIPCICVTVMVSVIGSSVLRSRSSDLRSWLQYGEMRLFFQATPLCPLADVWSPEIQEGLLYCQSRFCRHSCPGNKTKSSLPSALSPGQVGLRNTVAKERCHSCAGKNRVKGTFDSTCLLAPWRAFNEWYLLLSTWMSRNCQRPAGGWVVESILCWEVPLLSSQLWKRAKSVWIPL